MKLFQNETFTFSQEHAQKLESSFERIQRLIEAIGDRVYNLETIVKFQNEAASTLEADFKAANDQIKAISQVMVDNIYPGFENLDNRTKTLEEGLRSTSKALTAIMNVISPK